MKISHKLVRRTFLLLSPLLLATTMGGCKLLKIFFLLFCSLLPTNFSYNDLGISPFLKIVYVGDKGGILITPDGVRGCLTELTTFVPGQPDLNAITELGVENIGNIIVGENGTIVTLDGDSINFIPNPAVQNLNDICQDLDGMVLQSPNVVTVGDSGTAMKSTDHGLTWSVLSFPDLTNLSTCELRGDYILVGGNSPFIYQSEDCGGTWEMIGIGENSYSDGPPGFNAIFFVDDSVGYIGGDFGSMAKTTDGGNNWNPLFAPGFDAINDLFFISPDSGVAVGTNGIMRFTADGGITWEEDTEVTKLIGGKNIKTIIAVDEVSGRIIGDSLNIIFSTDSTLLTAVNEDGIHIHNYSLSNNYPNPFNPSTIIEYSLPQFGFVTLTVFDMLGREIATLVNEEKPVGNYKFEFNAGDLASGIYYYQIKIGNKFVETKKMVLLR